MNNAAFQQHQKSIEEITDEQLDHTFRTNIFGYFYMVRAALPYLHEGSAIINTGSTTGLEGSKELLDYSSTKGSIHAFTKSMAQNLLDRKIRVNCVAPGLDAVEPERCTAGEGGAVWCRHADEAPSTARGDRPGLRLLPQRGDKQLHHRECPRCSAAKPPRGNVSDYASSRSNFSHVAGVPSAPASSAATASAT